ncbi:MAG TPA: MFS transporter [Ktedonobacteraceae bacterium]|nr:MFS transporter [Ktedonobacteraceae bacterium]
MVQFSDARSSTPEFRVPRVYLVLAFAAFILIGANDGALGVLIPSMRTFYRVDNATISWLFLTTALGYLGATFNNGILMEQLGTRRFLLLSMAIFLLSTGLLSLHLPFAFFLCSGTLLGFGVGMIDAGLNAYVASLPNNTTLLNYLHAFYGAGALLGPLLASGLLAWHAGWQTIYLAWLCLAFIILSGLWLAFKPQVQPTQPSSSGRSDHILFETLRRRTVWLAALFILFYAGVEVGLGNWGYSFLTVARSGPLLFSAWVISGYWCGLTLGRLTLANLAPCFGIRRLVVLCLTGVALGLLSAWLIPTFWGVAFGLCVVGFAEGPLFPTIIALMPQLVPARLLAGAIGFLASSATVGVAFLLWVAGNLIQRLGFSSLLPFALVLTAGMSGTWLVLNREPAQK